MWLNHEELIEVEEIQALGKLEETNDANTNTLEPEEGKHLKEK